MATHKATIAGLQNDRQYGVRAFVRSPNGWQTAPDAFGFCTPMAFSRILAENSWAQIDAASRAGLAPTLWKVGDEKNITLTTGELLTLQIYGFNHDDLTGGGKAGITFGLKNLMRDQHRMNAVNTNTGGFVSSEMYSWLNNTIRNQLPADLQMALKSVNKRTSVGDGSLNISNNSMRIFLFSEIELTGDPRWSASGEGSKYLIFTDYASCIKIESNGAGAPNHWHNRSPLKSNYPQGEFCMIQMNGTINHLPASSATGVCFGFCV